MAWLTQTPVAVVRAHIEMMDRLRAEEAMVAATAAAIGSGTRKRSVVQTQWNKWKNVAQQGQGRRAQPASTDALRFMGVGVRMLPTRAGKG